MPAKLKAVLKGLAYAGFFFVALLFFVYMTLPLDALESYMVRKASDEYGSDLEITEMSMWGLSGLEMEGVTITPRPTPEEITAIREARAARAAWQARQQAKKDEGGEPAPADEPEKPAKAGPAKAGDPAAAKARAKADAKGPATTAKAAPEKAADKPPPVPAGPQPLSIDSLRAKVTLSKLLGDLMDGKLLNEDAEAMLEARLLGGAIDARVEKNSETTHLVANFQGLDLQQLTVLRNLLPLPIVGDFEGQIDVEIPQDDGGQFRLASTAGFLSLSLSNAVLGPGRIESDGLRNFGGFFDVPRLTLTEFSGKINFERRRATFEDFAFRGKDLEGDLTGSVQLANKLERFNPRAYLRFKFGDDFLEREKGIGVLMRTVPEIKRGTGSDGFTGFAVSVTTDRKSGGKKLKWRPTPRNPYGGRTTTRPATGAKKPTVSGGRDALRDRKTTRTRTRPSTKRPRLPKRAPTKVRKPVEPIEVDAPEPETAEDEDEAEDEEETDEAEDETDDGEEDGADDEATEDEGGDDEEETE